MGLVATAIFALASSIRSRPPSLAGQLLDPPLPSQDFTLASSTGPVSLGDFRGQVVVLFFGYTHCPDVCPLAMARLARSLRLLGRAAARIQVIMVSVDPDRDTPERMAQYVTAFDSAFVGLTGSTEEVSRVASLYGIFHARGEEKENYAVDHTAIVTIIDTAGRIRLLWPTDLTPEQMASDLRFVLR